MPRLPRLRHALVALSALAFLGGIVAFPGRALAQKAAIVSAVRTTEAWWWQYLKQKVTDTGLFPDGVEHIDIAYSDPTLMRLSAYKLLVVMASDYGISSSDGVGNALGDYMATVPGAAVLVFQPYTWQTGVASAAPIGGRFLANYALTTQGSTSSNTETKRGIILGNDELTDGVPEFECGANCARVTGTMPKPGATVVAYWSDGSILAVRGKRRIDLNMYPADDSVIAGSWKPAGGVLITNAIYYLSAPVLQSPRRAVFPSGNLGRTTAAVTLKFHNVSEGPVDITGIGIDGTGKSQFLYKASKHPTVAAPYTLPMSATLNVDTMFKPQVQGTHKATLYLNLAGRPRIEAPLEGVTKGNLYISMSPIDFGGIPSGTTAGPVNVRLKNLGTMPFDLDKPVIADTTHYQLTTSVPDAKLTIFPGATYSFDLKFTPGADVGQLSTEITINSTDASSPLTIPVLAMAGPPKAQVPYTSLLLPDVPTGATGVPIEIPITNVGFSDLLVNEISTDKVDFVVLNSPSTGHPIVIPAQQTQSFQLSFAPQAEKLRTGKLTVKTSEPPAMGMPDSNKTIVLSGNGTSPHFKVSQKDLDFGTVDIGATVPNQSLNLSNAGDGDLVVKDVSIVAGTGADAYAVMTTDPLPFVIRPGDTVPVQVAFAPKSAGSINATLRIVTDLAVGGSVTVGLTGSANGAVGKLAESKLEFGELKVKKKAVKTVTLTNDGNQDLTILKSTLTPTIGAFSALLPADGTKIAPGKSLSIDVSCIPAMVGLATGRLELETNDPATAGGTKYEVALRVSGVLSNVQVAPLELSFQPLLVGQRSDMLTFKVTNIGTLPVENLAVSISGSPATMSDDSNSFTAIPGYKTLLAPGETSEIGIVFEPRMSKGLLLATAVVQADGVQVPMTVALKGSSMSAALMARPVLLRFENTFVGTQSKPKYLTLSNEGSQPIEIEIAPPASDEFAVDSTETMLKLAPKDTTRVAVSFTPKSSGEKGEYIEVRLKGTLVVLAKVDLGGQGIKPPSTPTEMGGDCHMTNTPHTHPADFAPLLAFALCGLFLLVRRLRRQ